jgi:K(+)-stimulated pyrophosphate-energized sodium pump
MGVRRGPFSLLGVLLAASLAIGALAAPASAATADFRLEPRSPVAGDPMVKIRYTVEVESTTSFQVRILVDSTEIENNTFSFQPGQVREATWATPQAGRHVIRLYVDGALAREHEVLVAQSAALSPLVWFVPVAAAVGLVAAIAIAMSITRRKVDDEKTKEIAAAISEGASAFLRRQNRTIALFAIVLFILIFAVYNFVPSPVSGRSQLEIAVMTGVAFLIGAACSALSGFVGMYVSVRSNSRVSMASRKSFSDALKLAIRGGAVSGLMIISLCLLGIFLLFFAYGGGLDPRVTPFLLVGFGFGASFVALFAQLGGGIYTKAADVGADLVGKVEAGIPEDDPRNPGVIADNVGDNVGDCAGRGADIFESTAAENIGAMILGVALFPYFGVNGILFPLVAIALGTIASVVGVFAVNAREDEMNPMRPLNFGFGVTVGISLGLLYVANLLLLNGNGWFFAANVVGVLTSIAMLVITQYYTEREYRPVKGIADSSKTGPATNIIAGFAFGLETTALSVVAIGASLLAAFYLGTLGVAGMVGITAWEGGLYGTAMVTIGMLAPAAYVLALDTYGPITDNAGGINEMAGAPESAREMTDRLDATGNTTKALTKGYAIGSAALAAFLLFSAFIDAIEFYRPWTLVAVGSEVPVVNLGLVTVFVGALVGGMLIFLFASIAIRAVGKAAYSVIEEVRRQFREKPGIMAGTEKPDYGRAVDIVTQAALKEMRVPGFIVVVVPFLIGFFLGPEAVAGLLMVGTVVGILMATTLNNSGGAWDNAKKLIETEPRDKEKNLGKGSERHKAAVVGDTVGDPFKDTAGPSIHVVIKLLSTITLVLAPLFLILH